MTDTHHPYTNGLFGSIPVSGRGRRTGSSPSQGLMPDPTDLPEGCNFASPLPLLHGALPGRTRKPAMTDVGGTYGRSCHLAFDERMEEVRA